MHIEKRKLKKKTKYYLAHTIRIDKKIKKIRVYLGTNEKEAAKKRQYAEDIIKKRVEAYRRISDPFKTVLTSGELKEIRTLEAKGGIRIKHLDGDGWKKFTKAFTYDTNAIEGSTVTFKEVSDILEKDKWPDRKKWEISETYGVRDAVDHIRKTKTHISLPLIKELHKLTFKNSKSFAGNFRKRGQEVGVVDGFGQIIHRGAPSTLVTKLLG